uniref:man(5)GlcNAc(2)-PP-dolichol translocation protein RFT1 isoform X2 n=1 Tax=Myxine glutinosa TaxID=7769 RepID=UPI00358E3C9B
MSASAILRDTSTLASYNVILQVTFRLLTFFLNAFILRHVSQEMLGIVNVRLTLLYSTAVFLAREAFRRACLSIGGTHAWPQTINLLWMTFPIGLLSSAGLAYIWIYCLHVPDSAVVPGYRVAVLLFAFSVLLELLSEPLWVVAQAHLFIRLRVVADGVSVAAKCLLTAGLVTFVPHWGLWIFSLAQLLHTGLLSAVYVGYFSWYIGSPAARADNFPLSTWGSVFFCWKGKPFNRSLVLLIKSFMLQSFLKQILTEGVYDVVNNLGSLVARFVFLPIEESFYIFFVKVLTRGADVSQQNQEDLQLVAKVLGSLLKIVQFIGLTILCFGFSYSHLALHLYGGNALSQGIGSTLLRCYSVYVLLLAINGISECFVFAVMKQQELQRYNMYLVAFSCIFLTLSVLLTQALGSVGFIAANCLNMALRIAASVRYIHRFFAHSSHRPLQRLWLSPNMAASFVAVWALTSLSEMYMYTGAGIQGMVLHLAVGANCLVLLLIVMNKSEPELLIIARRHILPGQQQRKSE